jgi:hypothetical protein
MIKLKLNFFGNCDRCHGASTFLFRVWVKGGRGAWIKWLCALCEPLGRCNLHKMTRAENECFEEEERLREEIEDTTGMDYDDWQKRFWTQYERIQLERRRMGTQFGRSSAAC